MKDKLPEYAELWTLLDEFLNDSGLVSYGDLFDGDNVEWSTFLPGGEVQQAICRLQKQIGGELPQDAHRIRHRWCEIGRIARDALSLMPDPGAEAPIHGQLYTLFSQLTEHINELREWSFSGGDDASEMSKQPLSQRARQILAAMYQMNAFDSDHRESLTHIVCRALGPAADSNAVKSVMVELKSHGLIESKSGRSGGYWLTANGQVRAKSLPGAQP